MKTVFLESRFTALLLLVVFTAAACLMGCQIPKQPVEPMKSKYVRVEKIDGRYWFVHGSERFVELGVNVVEPVDGSKPKGGRVYNVLPKYNNDIGLWAKDAVARLRSWNFNTAAGWCHDSLYNTMPIYHTRVIWFGDWGARDSRLIDVFSETYATNMDKVARTEVAPHATNEYLIGWFCNNELPWYGERGWPTGSDVSLLSRYMHLPEKGPGKLRLIEFLKATYSNDFKAFAANWDVKAATFDDLLKARQITPKARIAQKDVIAWSGVVAEQYFKLCAETLRRYDANHLFLGVRFAERAQEPVMAACGQYADVISVNHYRRTGIFDAKQVGTIAALAGKPVMITEFSWRAMENSSGCPNTRGADVTVQTQQERADRFRTYATNVLSQPFIVGYDFFMYHDQPPMGRFDGEDSNYGLVDINDNFYTTLLGAITEVNGRAVQIHELSQTSMPTYDSAVLADYREIRVRGAEAPLAQPVVFVDGTSTFATWGDFPGGSKIDVEPSATNGFAISVKPGSGWGAGVTFQPAQDLPKNPDGSANLTGGLRIVVVLNARAGIRFRPGIEESGHGQTDAQTFRGYGNADGESYHPNETVTKDGLNEYVFTLSEMGVASAYGNQRGNSFVDTDAIATVNLFFGGSQSDFQLELISVRFE